MIVIPMTEHGDHFREAGYTTPRFMLTWRRKSLFFHALDSFRAHFATERFMIVLRDLENILSFVERELLLLGIPRNRVVVVALKNATNGRTETVAAGLRKAQIPLDVPLTIFNIDAFRKGFGYPQDFDSSDVDGYLEVFSGEGEDRSFVRPAPDRPDERRVAEVSEKARDSDLCCVGLHHFRSCGFYLSLYSDVESLRPGALQGGEYRVAFLHDRAARHGADIRYARIPSDDVKFFDTLSEYERRLRETPSEKPLAFCIGGQIRRDRRHLAAIAHLARRHEADVYISVWRKSGRKTLVDSMRIGRKYRVFGKIASFFLPLTVAPIDMFPEVERILIAYNMKDYSTELKEIFPNAVIDIEDEDTLDLTIAHSKEINSLRMLYKIWRCNRLKRMGEVMRGRKYEGVVRFRPDIQPSMKVFTETEMGPGIAVFPKGPNDWFWICGSETDDRLSNLFGNAVLAPDRKWSGIHKEIARLTARLSLTLKKDRIVKGGPRSANTRQDQAFARSLVCDALRSGRYSALVNMTRDDAKILAYLIECSDNPSAKGLTISRLRSMYSEKSHIVIIRNILILILLISKSNNKTSILHHCSDLILLIITVELGMNKVIKSENTIHAFMHFLTPFRNMDSKNEPLLLGVPDTRQPHDLWREVGSLLREDTSSTTGSGSPLEEVDELVWIIHRDLLVRLGEERFLTIARSIRDLD